jgi:hypothetical protein
MPNQSNSKQLNETKHNIMEDNPTKRNSKKDLKIDKIKGANETKNGKITGSNDKLKRPPRVGRLIPRINYR